MTYYLKKSSFKRVENQLLEDYQIIFEKTFNNNQANDLIQLNNEAKQEIQQDISSLCFDSLVVDKQERDFLRFYAAVLYQQNEPVGFAYSGYCPDINNREGRGCSLDVVYLISKHRNRGIGASFISIYLERVMEIFPDYVFFKAVTQDSNLPAQKLLEKLGFDTANE